MATNPVSEQLQRAVQRLRSSLSAAKSARDMVPEADCMGPQPRVDSVILARQRFGFPAEPQRRPWRQA
jgi:hypothetical protein